MKNIIATVIAASLMLCSYVQAECDYSCDASDDEVGFYAEIFGGANFLQKETNEGITGKYKTGYIVSGSLGYSLCYGIRFEGEYAYRRNTLENIKFFGRTFPIQGHYQSSSYMANLLWDLPIQNWGCNLWKIQPIIGGGMGYDVQQIHGSNFGFSYRDNKKGFAWQVLAGLGYPIFCNTRISVEYKFHKGRLNQIYNHSVGAGLTYDFGPLF